MNPQKITKILLAFCLSSTLFLAEARAESGLISYKEAIRNQDLKAVQSAVQLDLYSIDIKDQDGRTPLWHAVEAGHLNMVKFFLEYGANPDAVDTYGKSALGIAVTNKALTIVKVLLENGANPDMQMYNKPLLITAIQSESLLMVKALLDAGANPYMNYFGISALDYTKSHTKAMENLIKQYINDEL